MKGCETGCKTFEGGEIKHHPDCNYYAGSQSEKADLFRRLTNALRDLYDEQNGAPLVRRELHWMAAYQSAGDVLKIAEKLLNQTGDGQ